MTRYWAGPGSAEDGTVELGVPGVTHRISLEVARRLARELGEAADRVEAWARQRRAQRRFQERVARQKTCSNCGGVGGHNRCRGCGGLGICSPRTSGRPPATECGTCRGWGCVPASGGDGQR